MEKPPPQVEIGDSGNSRRCLGSHRYCSEQHARTIGLWSQEYAPLLPAIAQRPEHRTSSPWKGGAGRNGETDLRTGRFRHRATTPELRPACSSLKRKTVPAESDSEA